MFERNICQFVPSRNTELDLQPLHFVLETNQVGENNTILSVYRVYFVIEGEGIYKTIYNEHKVTKGSVFFCFRGKVRFRREADGYPVLFCPERTPCDIS